MNYDEYATKQFERDARRAVGSALLKKFSKNGGGSSGRGIDEDRARKLAERGIDGDELMELLMNVAMNASERAQMTSRMMQELVMSEVERVAVESDSLALYRFVQVHKGNS